MGMCGFAKSWVRVRTEDFQNGGVVAKTLVFETDRDCRLMGIEVQQN